MTSVGLNIFNQQIYSGLKILSLQQLIAREKRRKQQRLCALLKQWHALIRLAQVIADTYTGNTKCQRRLLSVVELQRDGVREEPVAYAGPELRHLIYIGNFSFSFLASMFLF